MVVVVDELGRDRAEMTFVDGNQVVEALPTGCHHPAFRLRVRAGRLNHQPANSQIQLGRPG